MPGFGHLSNIEGVAFNPAEATRVRRAPLAFLISGGYNFGRFGGATDVDFHGKIKSRISVGGALSGGADGARASHRADIFRLARRLPEQSDGRPKLEHLRQLCRL